MKSNNEDNKRKLPINKAEDVEFSKELADQDDLKALERSQKQTADNKNKSYNYLINIINND